MRPVTKWVVGTNNVNSVYNSHGEAKLKLLDNFGNEPFYFCNYCDRSIPMVNMEVEHIQCVHHYPEHEFEWSNFLLACKNCNLAKGDTNFAIANVLLPQFQNTWNCFVINNDGTVNADVTNANAYSRAHRTVEMLGLNRGANHPGRQPQDDRYNARRHVLFIAHRALRHYEKGMPDYADTIIFQAISTGFWYVWMKVFENHQEIQNALIVAFNSTYDACLSTDVDRN